LTVWIVVTGDRSTLPLFWNAEELEIIAVYDNEPAAAAHAAQLNALAPARWEIASVLTWDVKS
jgi:hypothetical protein